MTHFRNSKAETRRSRLEGGRGPPAGPLGQGKGLCLPKSKKPLRVLKSEKSQIHTSFVLFLQVLNTWPVNHLQANPRWKTSEFLAQVQGFIPAPSLLQYWLAL